jgi:hypothetical protein
MTRIACVSEAAMPEPCAELERFIRGEADPGRFSHREHVQMGFEILRRHAFVEAVQLFSRALRAMLDKSGRSAELFHHTVTIAFLSLIAERLGTGEYSDFAVFAHSNPDLLDKSALTRWYHPERLASDLARRTFLLPDRPA